MDSTLQNHLLIAMPALTDTFFYRSVVYLCEHDQNGAMGLIINRPTKVMLEELLGHLNIDNSNDFIKHTPVLFGGPVQKSQGMVLHDQADAPWNTNLQLTEALCLTTSTDILQALGTEAGPANAVVTLGYAGWSAGQLEQELSENSWLSVPASHQLLFETAAEDRWQAAAAQLGFDINLMSSTSGHA